MKKSQSWSFDVIIATAVFFGIFVAFFVLLQGDDEQDLDDVKKEAEYIAEQLKKSDAFVEGELTQSGMESFATLNYSSWKISWGVRNDFCIYLQNEEGNLIPINGTVYGVGSSDIEIGGASCS